MVIVTDLDDVLIQLLPRWIEVLNERYGYSVTKADIKQWSMEIPFEGLTPDQIYGPLHEAEFWASVKPCKGAQKYLKMLMDEGHQVYIATSTHYATIHDKVVNAVLPNFPFLPYKNIMISYNKGLIKCDYLIDDYHENFRGSDAVRILVDAPYNRECDLSLYNYRVEEDWAQIYTLIHDLEDTTCSG